MHSSPNRLRAIGLAAVAAASLAYPGLVYLGAAEVPPLAFVVMALLLIGCRLAVSRRDDPWRLPMVAAAAAVMAVALLDGGLAAKAYPVVLSLCFAAAFGASLFYPPSLIERLARLTEPDLPPEGAVYCRRLTLVWAGWLTVNAAVAAMLALSGDDAAWALWTGVASYLITGALFGGELLVRRLCRWSRFPE